MRKSVVATVAVLLALALVVPAIADTKVDVYDNDKLVKSVVFKVGVNKYFVNNEVPGTAMDVAPFIENGRTYVPVRYLSNALGVTDENIGWDESNLLVTLAEPGFPKVELTIGNKTIKSDGQARQMDVAPVIRDARTFLPARFVAEALGYQVEWDAANKVVVCWPAGAEKPDISLVIDHLDGDTPAEPPAGPPDDAKVIDLTGKGEPLPAELRKYVLPGSKITWLSFDEFNSNVYKVSYIETHGMRVTADRVYITQKGGCVGVALHDGGEVYRSRHSSGPPEARGQKYEYPYTVVLPAYDAGAGWPDCDITKVRYILLHANGTFIGVDNPMFKGGK